MKTQTVRLLDIFLIGPMMIARARDAGKSDFERALWVAVGIATIVYNGENWIKARQ
jgi:threonine/homoserine/homoserine lactone efflux protein